MSTNKIGPAKIKISYYSPPNTNPDVTQCWTGRTGYRECEFTVVSEDDTISETNLTNPFNRAISTEIKDIEAEQPNILRADMNAADFSNALLGSWKSAFTSPQGANIQQIHFFPDDTATVTVISNGRENTIAGQYQLEFEKEPQQNMITLAKIKINSDSDTVTLSRVHFGLHNGVMLSKGPLLRIDKEPYGDIIWLMPKDYEGGKYNFNETHAAVPPVLIESTYNYKVYVWDCPDTVQNSIIKAIKNFEQSTSSPGEKMKNSWSEP